VVVYAGTVGLVLPPTSDSEAITAAVDRLSASGSTAGGQGLQLAYATARANFVRDGINRIILATDGDFNVGLSDTRALMDLVRREKAGGITLTTLGFGTGNYNDEMMEAIASAGNGNYAYIDSEAEARKVLDEELSSTLFTIARDVKVQVEFNPGVVAEYRLIGYENRLLSEADFRNDAVEGGDIGAGHRVTALYEIALVGSKGQRLGERRYEANRKVPVPGKPGELAYVRLRYKQGEAAASREFGKAVPASLAAGAARPTGELAFAAAVAGLGQALRGGTYLNGFGYKDAQRLAEASGTTGDVHRRQFIGLAALADAQAPKPAR
jgi:Ca-activated chloride channel family protein